MARSRTWLAGMLGLAVPIALAEGQQAPQRWTLTEERRIGAEVPDALTEAGAALLLPDGGVVVLDRTQHQLLLFDANGRLRRSIGRRGRGPGEFEYPERMGVHDGSLWVADPRLGRVSVFAIDGTLRNTIPASALGSASGAPQALATDGSVLLLPVITLGGGTTATTRSFPLVRARPGASGVDTLRSIQRSEGVRFIALPRGRYAVVDPFLDQPLIGFSPRGDLIVIVDRRIATGADGATFGIEVLGSDGTLLGSRRHDYAPQAVSRSERDSVHAALAHPDLIALYPSADAARAAIAEGVPEPRRWPPVLDMLIGSDSTIWLRRPRNDWLVLSASGDRLAIVGVPHGDRLLAVSSREVITVRLDALDVPAVLRHRVARER